MVLGAKNMGKNAKARGSQNDGEYNRAARDIPCIVIVGSCEKAASGATFEFETLYLNGTSIDGAVENPSTPRFITSNCALAMFSALKPAAVGLPLLFASLSLPRRLLYHYSS